jgi:hypothetical protein
MPCLKLQSPVDGEGGVLSLMGHAASVSTREVNVALALGGGGSLGR